MNLISAAEIHLTDFSFSKLCENKFGINRGIYNTIDSTFYEKGIRDIISRRKTIISFLSFAVGTSRDLKYDQHKFGHGGLSLKINEFLISEMKIIEVINQSVLEHPQICYVQEVDPI